MFYVLFTYSKGQKERDFRGFRSEDDLIKFLHKDYEKIDIVQIIGVEKSYRLGLIETDELVKSILVSQELKVDLSGQGVPLPPIEEKIGYEKIADDIEKKMTEEEIIKKNEELLKKADKQIAAAKDLKLTWPTCPVCKERKMAPWNKTGKCSYCQTYKKKLRKKEEEI